MFTNLYIKKKESRFSGGKEDLELLQSRLRDCEHIPNMSKLGDIWHIGDMVTSCDLTWKIRFFVASSGDFSVQLINFELLDMVFVDYLSPFQDIFFQP
ncbi:hypothetical protein SUGI_0259330 [Cryptomeria japonica]|nr:hypothetical protein SUGI_0259330 [Cryptomeria japonica]